MKFFIAAASLLLQSDATQEETSLMQGVVVRRGQMSPESSSEHDDGTAKLMETATKMIKNGATPDVINFIEATIDDVNDKVLGVIVEEHHRDQATINRLNASFYELLDRRNACQAQMSMTMSQQEEDENEHKVCRSEESLLCARSRKCEADLELLWQRVKREEEEMRRIHWAIHGEWCEADLPAPFPHPNLDDPFRWPDSVYWEGDETSQSVMGGRVADLRRGQEDTYPSTDVSFGMSADIIEFRRFSVDYFGQYRAQRLVVETAWEEYNQKLIECAAAEESLSLKVDVCDGLQDDMHREACSQQLQSSQCSSDFGNEYRILSVTYAREVRAITQREADRKREWETLHIVTCLLETVYTHVIHAIDSGEPCPTIESHPEQTAAEINTCHIVEESFTANLTIDIPSPPIFQSQANETAPPCTAQYIWDQSGSFPNDVQTDHRAAIEAEGLGQYFTALSEKGWGGCAAPKACITCEEMEQGLTLSVDPTDADHQECLEHHLLLQPGDKDWHTFKCLDGNECIPASERCDGENQCGDASDEEGCFNAFHRRTGIPPVLGFRPCNNPFTSDVQFQCVDGFCIDAVARCDGVTNCLDGSDELNCDTSSSTGVQSTWTASRAEGSTLTVEPMTGRTASFEAPDVDSEVFSDRSYRFTSLGSFAGFAFLKMSNEDKHIRSSHVQVKLRLPKPLTVYVVKLETTHLPWLITEGWIRKTDLHGVSYSGMPKDTMHTEWRTGHNWASYPDHVLNQGAAHFATAQADFNRRLPDLRPESYEAGDVWQKTFPAGAVEMRGNNGGDGSYLIFVANPEHPPTATTTTTTTTTTVFDGSGRRGPSLNTGRVQYEKLAYGASGCAAGKTIDTYAECETAHNALGLEVNPVWTGTLASIPGRCSTRERDWGGNHHFHFNNQAVGRSRSDLAPVCRV